MLLSADELYNLSQITSGCISGANDDPSSLIMIDRQIPRVESLFSGITV